MKLNELRLETIGDGNLVELIEATLERAIDDIWCPYKDNTKKRTVKVSIKVQSAEDRKSGIVGYSVEEKFPGRAATLGQEGYIMNHTREGSRLLRTPVESSLPFPEQAEPVAAQPELEPWSLLNLDGGRPVQDINDALLQIAADITAPERSDKKTVKRPRSLKWTIDVFQSEGEIVVSARGLSRRAPAQYCVLPLQKAAVNEPGMFSEN